MAKARGTLSTQGWLRTPEARLDGMIAEYLLANPSQTLMYRGKVSSLAATIQRVGKDPDRLNNAIQDDLKFKTQINFPERDGGRVDVNCVTNEDNEITIQIGITVYENGLPYHLNEVLATSDSTFVRYGKADIV